MNLSNNIAITHDNNIFILKFFINIFIFTILIFIRI